MVQKQAYHPKTNLPDFLNYLVEQTVYYHVWKRKKRPSLPTVLPSYRA